MRTPELDAVVVGAGLNGLAAAITLAEAGCRVAVFERAERPGGAVGSDDALGPGTVRDVGAAVFPFGPGGPFLGRLPLARHGLRWRHPELPLAHPLPDGAAVLHRDLARTAAGLGRDGPAWRALLEPLAEGWDALAEDLLRPLPHRPRHPGLAARFGLRGLPPASWVARALFRGEPARALLAGLAGHAGLPLGTWGSSAPGLVLGALAHGPGWPLPEGGARRVADALAAHLRALGGELVLGTEVRSLAALPEARVVLLDVAPRALARLARDRLPGGYRRRLERWPRGPGVFKLDLLLDGPAPWRDPRVAGAGTVHLGGPLVALERGPGALVLVAQPSATDATRAPAGRHVLWAYTHVPNGSTEDRSEGVLAELERHAPGLRERVLARVATTAAGLERISPNLVGGDLAGGPMDAWHLLARPVPSAVPYRTPAPGLYLCSASTPPGGGAHGMCGVRAAEAALARELA